MPVVPHSRAGYKGEAFEAAGGTVTINAAHEDGKADYSAEIGALAAAGGDRLVVAGYVDQGGSGIVRAALDSGAFDTFHFPDGMISAKLVENFGSDLDGSSGAANFGCESVFFDENAFFAQAVEQDACSLGIVFT